MGSHLTCQNDRKLIRAFHKYTKLAILASEAFLYKKKIQQQKISEDWIGDLLDLVWCSLSELTWHVPVSGSLNYLWFMHHWTLMIRFECQVGSERRVLDQNPRENSSFLNYVVGIFCFHVVKPLVLIIHLVRENLDRTRDFLVLILMLKHVK